MILGILSLFFAMTSASAQVADTSLEWMDPLQIIVKAGQKNLAWMDRINQERIRHHEIMFDVGLAGVNVNVIRSFKQTPTDPKKLNHALVLAEFKRFNQIAPLHFLTEVMGPGELDSGFYPLSQDQYLEWSTTLNSIYEDAKRWIQQRSQLEESPFSSTEDLRGYLFLKNYPQDLKFTLQNFTFLARAKQSKLARALISLCHNSEQSISACRAELSLPSSQTFTVGSLTPEQFYAKYHHFGEEIYRSHFQAKPRPGISWTKIGAKEITTITLQDPEDARLKEWLKKEIESVWYWGNWQVQVEFSKHSDSGAIRINLIPGALPHVNYTDEYSQITLDKDMPYDQVQNAKVLRHEMGHILGFPDCYVEFYDSSEKAMIYYGLNAENIMCSWNGTVLEEHYQKLKRAYTHVE